MDSTLPSPLSPEFLFFEELRELCYECSGLRKELNEFIYQTQFATPPQGAALFERFQKLSLQCQRFILGAKQLHQSPSEMDIQIAQSPLMREKEGFGPAAFNLIVGFALMSESPLLTEAIKWSMEWLHLNDRGPDDEGFLPAGLYDQIEYAFNGNEAPQHESPAFFSDGQFRDGPLFLRVYRDRVHDQLDALVEDCQDNASQTHHWVQVLEEVQRQDAQTAQVIMSYLFETLRDKPIKGLEPLREIVLGLSNPCGDECSRRTALIVNHITDSELKETHLHEHISAIRSNPEYMDEAFVEDLVAGLASRNIDDNFFPRVSEFFNEMQMSVDQMTEISLRIVGFITRGSMMDYRKKPVGERLKALMNRVHNEASFAPSEGSLDFAILTGLVKNLPHELVMEMASVCDDSRVMIYKMTSDSRYLKHMQNPKKVDDVIGRDLGL